MLHSSYHKPSSEKKSKEDLDQIEDSSYIVINTPVKLIGRRPWKESRVLEIKLNHQTLKKKNQRMRKPRTTTPRVVIQIITLTMRILQR